MARHSPIRSFGLFVWAACLLAPAWGWAGQDRQRELREEEKTNYYKKWLREDVVYLITDEERSVFTRLSNDAERDAFIEQFWRRRDPDQLTSINEFKEEHYRRVAYANEHFTSGVEGWATDRGRIYILFGRPNQIEDHMGGMYMRRPEEGGGFTSSYAFQRWFYNYLPGIGAGIEIEFVDPSKTGEYRIALRPSEKDALWHTGAGPTRWEELGYATRAGTMTSDLALRNLGLAGEPLYMRGAQPFDRIRQYFALSRPPDTKFSDLRAEVDARVLYNPIPLEVTTAAFRVGQNAFLAPFTVEIPAAELSYQALRETARRAVVAVYGKVEDLGGRIVFEFEDLLAGDSGAEEVLAAGTRFLYQKQLPLGAGRYKVTLVARDQSSERLASVATSLFLPPPELGNLQTSGLILADGVTSSSRQETLSDPFNTPSGLKVYPNVRKGFGSRNTVHVYAEVYEVRIDQALLQPDVEAELILLREGRRLHSQEPKMLQLPDRLALLAAVDLKGAVAGTYQLLLQVRDRISGQRLVEPASFTVLP